MFEPRVPLKRLEKSIVEFEQKPIETGKILFYGSSGFTRWKPKYNHRPLEEDIRRKDGSPAAVNHGFGGVEETGILVKIPDMYPEKVDRYITPMRNWIHRIRVNWWSRKDK